MGGKAAGIAKGNASGRTFEILLEGVAFDWHVQAFG
jgi:hypothetical protein